MSDIFYTSCLISRVNFTKSHDAFKYVFLVKMDLLSGDFCFAQMEFWLNATLTL